MPDERTGFFDSHAPQWDACRPADLPQRLERVVRETGIAPGAHVLDLGCGTGVLIPHILPRLGASGRITALDLSGEMLRMAREKGFDGRVSLIQADAQRLPFLDASFDALFCNAALPHFSDRRVALREMARVLRPGGLLAISHPIGRGAVNRLHQSTGGAVGEDRVPPAGALSAWLNEAAIAGTLAVDEAEFYLVVGRRSTETP